MVALGLTVVAVDFLVVTVVVVAVVVVVVAVVVAEVTGGAVNDPGLKLLLALIRSLHWPGAAITPEISTKNGNGGHCNKIIANYTLKRRKRRVDEYHL